MTKEQIVQRFIELNDGSPFISLNTVKQLTKLGYSKCSDLVDGLDTMTGPKHGDKVTRLYFADDVAQRIMERGLSNVKD